jgi:CRP/FNR family transcriptional regulator, cyclic AMP receptor protein
MRGSEASSSGTNVALWPPTSYLGRLAPSTRNHLLSLGRRRKYPDGIPLIREGDITSVAHVLLDGSVKVSIAGEFGDVALIGVRVGGDIVGETEALDEAPPLATVTAAGTVDAIAMTTNDLRDFLRRSPDALLAMSQWLASEQRALAYRLVDFVTADAPTRLARVLLDLAERYGEQTPAGITLGVPLAQNELAALVGARGPTVQRTLRQLRQHGVIATGYRSITITDAEALRTLSHPHSKR